MLTCYIVDDEVASIEVISDYISQTSGLQLLGSTTRPHDMIEIMFGPEKPDIAFLDIDMPRINGLELAGIINQYTAVIFISAYPQYGAEAFEKDAYDFLSKPVSYARFMQAIFKVKNRMQANAVSEPEVPRYFYVKENRKGEIIRVYFEDLIYIKAAENYVNLHTVKYVDLHMVEEVIFTYFTLKELEFKLAHHDFIRIHKSHMVNLNKIQGTQDNDVIMEDQTKLAIGPIFKKKLTDALHPKMIVTDRAHSSRQ